jgi:hypothetical protein
MIEFLHAHLLLILLAASGVLVAGGGALLIRHVVRSKRDQHAKGQHLGRKPRGSATRRKRFRRRASR